MRFSAACYWATRRRSPISWLAAAGAERPPSPQPGGSAGRALRRYHLRALPSLSRVLELVCREVGASDARLELGGKPPSDPKTVWVELERDWRLVASFDEPPSDRDEACERLRTVAASFQSSLDEARDDAPKLSEGSSEPASRLSEVLELLASRCSAVGAVVVDVDSPVMWGTSEGAAWADDAEVLTAWGDLAMARPEPKNLAALMRGEGAPLAVASSPQPSDEVRRRMRARAHVLADPSLAAARIALAKAVAHARRARYPKTLRDDDGGHVIRAFSAIYRLVLAFDGPFSELHAEANTARALPLVERLVDNLPPVDPTPTKRGAQVFPLGRTR